MLKITVPIGDESFDEVNGLFVNSEYFTLELEHSLASMAKWEEQFEKPFLGDVEKTAEESIFYYRECMLLTKNPPEGIFERFNQGHYDTLQNYIGAKRSATWFNEPNNRPPGSRQVITAEVVYGWMVALRIPFETQYWHLSRLFTLIKVCNEQMKKPKKMGRAEAARQQAALNAQRRAAMKTGG